jgi:phosphatidylglycerophosphate synthase
MRTHTGGAWLMRTEGSRQWLDEWSALHGVRPSGVVVWWLRGVYRVARHLTWLPPLGLTAGGMVAGWLAVWPAAAGLPALGSLCIVVGAACDALDGAVEVLSGRVSAFGAVADAAADRLTEVAYALALWLAGAPAWLCAAVCGVGVLHELMRARAGRALPLTVGERPTRVLFAAFGLLGASVVGGSPPWVALCWLVVAVAGFGQLSYGLTRPASASQ